MGSETGLWWIYMRIILLRVGLVSRRHGFNFVHGRVEVLDVLWGVQTSRVVVLVGYNFGAKGKSAPVVAGADEFHFLSTNITLVSFWIPASRDVWGEHAVRNVQQNRENPTNGGCNFLLFHKRVKNMQWQQQWKQKTTKESWSSGSWEAEIICSWSWIYHDNTDGASHRWHADDERTKAPRKAAHASHRKHGNASQNVSGINYRSFPLHIIPESGTRH